MSDTNGPANDNTYTGNQSLFSLNGKANTFDFSTRNLMSTMRTCTLVRVVKCTSHGEIGEAGRVDVQPLIDQQDGQGRSIPLAEILDVPFFRLQGGENAVVNDPEPDDIGFVVLSDRDASNAIETKAQGVPPTRRMYDLADALYIGGVRNKKPKRILRFFDGGVELISDGVVHVTGAKEITVKGDANVTVRAAGKLALQGATVSVTAPTS